MDVVYILIIIVFVTLYFYEKSSYSKKINALKQKYDKDKEIQVSEYNSLKAIHNEFYNKYKDIDDIHKELQNLTQIIEDNNSKLQKIINTRNQLNSEIDKLNQNINVLQDKETDLYIYGLYENKYDFESSILFKNRLEVIQEKQKVLMKNNVAVKKNVAWTISGSTKEGDIYLNKIISLMLKAFNSECDVIIKNVKYSTVNKYIDRIQKLSDVINKITDKWGCEITNDFVQLKIDELTLSYEYQVKLEMEREEQRRIKEQIREEEKALREAEKAKQEALAEEKRYMDALNKAKEELSKAQGSELDTLIKQIEELNIKLLEAEQKKERAISLAQLTKTGYVYIISNIGSFGENIYKIGMTRRAEPLDRVKELGDASVPFDFDVHALIFSNNAPELENMLHKVFEKNRVNKVNMKKEYFKVDINEIQKATKEKGYEFEFTLLADAKEYRETLYLESMKLN